jgi:hypothetical protein
LIKVPRVYIPQYLASDKASCVTGAKFFVDGSGITLYSSFATSSEHEMEKHDSRVVPQ